MVRHPDLANHHRLDGTARTHTVSSDRAAMPHRRPSPPTVGRTSTDSRRRHTLHQTLPPPEFNRPSNMAGWFVAAETIDSSTAGLGAVQAPGRC